MLNVEGVFSKVRYGRCRIRVPWVGLFLGDAYVFHRSVTLGARFGLMFGFHAVATGDTLVGVGWLRMMWVYFLFSHVWSVVTRVQKPCERFPYTASWSSLRALQPRLKTVNYARYAPCIQQRPLYLPGRCQ